MIAAVGVVRARPEGTTNPKLATGDIEVMNKDLVICHLDEGATLNMEMTADTGKGYVPAVSNRPVDAPIGLIPVDSLYSPVRQVSYKVDNARIGQELLLDVDLRPLHDDRQRLDFHFARLGDRVFENGAPLEQVILLQHIADLAVRPGDRPPVEKDRAAVRELEAMAGGVGTPGGEGVEYSPTSPTILATRRSDMRVKTRLMPRSARRRG